MYIYIYIASSTRQPPRTRLAARSAIAVAANEEGPRAAGMGWGCDNFDAASFMVRCSARISPVVILNIQASSQPSGSDTCAKVIKLCIALCDHHATHVLWIIFGLRMLRFSSGALQSKLYGQRFQIWARSRNCQCSGQSSLQCVSLGGAVNELSF